MAINMNVLSLLAEMKNKAEGTKTTIKASEYSKDYGDLAETAFNYSKRVLTLEGVLESEAKKAPTETDLMLAKLVANDIGSGSWDGDGQVMNKLFSIFLGRNLNAKSNGVRTRLVLPKGTVVKTTHGIGMIGESGSLLENRESAFTKNLSYDKTNQEVDLASKEETMLFFGELLSSPSRTRNLGSLMKVSSKEDLDNMYAISNNGLDAEKSDQLEYKQYFVKAMNPDLTMGAIA